MSYYKIFAIIEYHSIPVIKLKAPFFPVRCVQKTCMDRNRERGDLELTTSLGH